MSVFAIKIDYYVFSWPLTRSCTCVIPNKDRQHDVKQEVEQDGNWQLEGSSFTWPQIGPERQSLPRRVKVVNK
jgi:hypothetical protein